MIDSACITISGNLVNKVKFLIGKLKKVFNYEFEN